MKAQLKVERDTKLQEEEESLKRTRKEQNELLQLSLSNARQILEKSSDSEYGVDNNDFVTNSLKSTHVTKMTTTRACGLNWRKR